MPPVASRAPRQRLSPEERRATIVAAALAVFAERGYPAASVDEIVGRAGVSAPVLYDHFESKRDLYEHLLERQTDELIARVGAAVARASGGEARLRVAFDAFFSLVEEQPFVHRMISADDGGDPELRRAVERRDEQGRAGVAALLAVEATIFEGEPDRDQSLAMVAQMLRHGLNGLALWWRAHPEVPRDVVVDRAMDLAWRGLDSLTRSWDGQP